MVFLKNIFLTTMTYVMSPRFFGVLWAKGHPVHLKRHRLDTIFGRVRLVSVVFAILTLCWIPVDVLTFAKAEAFNLSALRVVVALLFLAIAAVPQRDWSPVRVMMAVAIMLLNPLILYAAAELLVGVHDLAGLAQVNANLYAALPYVVLVGLSLFPFVALETVVLALPIVGLAIFMPWFTGNLAWVDLVSTIWVLGLMLGICLLAGMIQVYYMEALLRRASYDPLTGAMTRRSGVEALAFNYRLAADKDAPLSLAFFDLDHFKSLNDSFGHDAGDAALRGAVSVLERHLREADSVIRWGGEEFVVLMSDTTLDGARVVMHRIMDDWLGERPDGQPLTASIGVAERLTDGGEDWDALVAIADERMYRAKTGGRARCVCGEEVLVPESVM